MDYEKKYKEALKVAKDIRNGEATYIPNGTPVIEAIFPELKESEESDDERIRKNCIHFLELQKQHHAATFEIEECIDWLEKQGEQKPNPYSGTSFEYNGHTWGMCARDNGVEILIDGHLKGRVFTDDSNAKEMFIKALERVEEQNSKGYKLTDCDKNSWWEDFKTYTSCPIEQKPTYARTTGYWHVEDIEQKPAWSEEDEAKRYSMGRKIP